MYIFNEINNVICLTNGLFDMKLNDESDIRYSFVRK